MAETSEVNPTVSVNICCFNSERYLEETIESVASQSFKDWELVLINDGSTDATESIILDYKRRGLPIVYRSQPNSGLGASRNVALQLSNGSYIALIDHDDLWEHDFLTEAMLRFKTNSDVGLVFADSYHFDDVRGVYTTQFANIDVNRLDLRKGNVVHSLLTKGCFVDASAVVLKKDLVASLGGFNPKLAYVEDYDLWLRLGGVCSFEVIDRPLARWRRHASQQTRVLGSRRHEELLFLAFRHIADLSRMERLRFLGVTISRQTYHYFRSLAAVDVGSGLKKYFSGFGDYA
jgi:glycosyltransferase involved in cell wall biosynthesis